MPDYSIIEIALITGGADAIREHEQPGDYEVSVLIDHSPLPGDLFRRVRALVRDRRLAVFPASLVAKDEIDAYPLLGTVRGVHEALANNQHFGGDGGLPTGLRLEEALNLPNVDLGSRIQLVTVGTDRRVRFDLTDDELREMLVWHFRQSMRAYIYRGSKGVEGIQVKDIERIADDAFRRVFSEIRNEVVVTGRDVGTAP